jgi:cellulose synthase/poly-beta-1,6-N-acetylglucosamine synthase-like glycosyltransferase
MEALYFLKSLDLFNLILLFWYTTVLELPRYVIGAVVTAFTQLFTTSVRRAAPPLRMTMLLVGHNEAAALRACVEGLNEQTLVQQRGPLEIVVVDDGSMDRMAEIARELQREGKIDKFLQVHQRGGKSAGVNLGFSACTGDIVVILDIDTTMDRDALEIMLSYFDRPDIGAVSGDIGVRNATKNLISRFQTIEYAIGISLGRRIAETLGMLSIVSGAFGAFRREAIESIGRQDVEVGEDADLTLKLRRAGWKIRFAPDARALTDVPESIIALTGQRLRWDRGIITIWLRKFRSSLDPRMATFRLADAAIILDVFLFQALLAFALPAYLIWLACVYGEFMWTVVAATLIGYIVLDLLSFLTAAAVAPVSIFWLIPYLPFYTVMQVTIMRVIRLFALVQELFFRSSYRDPYVPARVMLQVDRV